MHGDALVPSTLEAAGALRRMSSSPARNPMRTTSSSRSSPRSASTFAVIARVNDPANDDFDHSWGVDALVSPATSLVSMIRPES